MDAAVTLEPPPADMVAPSGSKTQCVLLMPLYHSIEPETFESLFIALKRYGMDKVRLMTWEKTRIESSRSILATNFLNLEDKPPYAIFIDSDMGLPTGDPDYFRTRFKVKGWERWSKFNFFERMMSHPYGHGIVGASYFDRQLGTQLQCADGCGSVKKPGFNEKFLAGELHGLVPMDWVATGVQRVSRWVFERMRDQAHARFPEIVPSGRTTNVIEFFTPWVGAQGEDCAFGMRAKQIKIQSYLDADIRCAHKGSKFY